ncbi:hypothetical protein LTR50_000520 [Elasticomyces elasticus]|nr:hypothetical protein LTR50_000519 [Elasticomyces elasticus]KAK4993296.1 hypothetical protein LTR50_000520 [Elasticomyces elasticus]
MSRSNSWTPHSYPIQSLQVKPPDGIVIAEESFEKLLPETIRACKDAHSSISKGRTLIVCLDGTGDKFDNDNSNVIHLVSCLKKDDLSQVTYYQAGIGTYNGSGLATGISAAFDMAIGSGLGTHVRDAYRFLMQNYCEGDKICLFGFSRGAYTARCLAGMLHKVGLLPAHNYAQIPFAYQCYKDDSPEGWKMSEEFKRTFSMDASAYFVGVWDCVASVGLIPRKLPFSSTPTSRTGHFRHAMALDEHRAKFKVCPWVKRDRKPRPADERTATIPEPERAAQTSRALRGLRSTFSTEQSNGLASKASYRTSTSPEPVKNGKNDKIGKTDSGYEERVALNRGGTGTDVLEVWFLGCHADVGGGAVANEERHMLSRIPLRWMIRQCFECDTGILFRTAALADKGLDVYKLWPIYNSSQKPVVGPSPMTMERYESGRLAPISSRSTTLRTAISKDGENDNTRFSDDEEASSATVPTTVWLPEQFEDYFDAMAPINDMLTKAKGWWILELWPIKVRVQKKNVSNWEKKVSFNLGRYRAVQDLEPNLHWTVRQRIHDKRYKIRTRVDRNALWRVVV